MNRMFRCKLQHDNGTIVPYFGPAFAWGPELHMVMRYAVAKQDAA
jgi:hypothetical protein